MSAKSAPKLKNNPLIKFTLQGQAAALDELAVAQRPLLGRFCLSHTNKHQDAQGKNVFAGVGDIIDDLDCAYVIDVRPGEAGEKVAQFTNKKRRGNVPDTLAYAYSPEPELSYVERLTSVHETDAVDGGNDDGLDYQTNDDSILESIALSIHHGGERGKMELIRSVAKLSSVSKRRVLKLLELHTGEDPEAHRWRYVVGARGVHAFELLRPIDDLFIVPPVPG